MLLTAFIALVAAAAFIGSGLTRDDVVRLALNPRVLVAVMIGAAVAGLVWCTLLISSYRSVRPTHLTGGGRFTAGTAVTVLCLAVTAPLAFAGRYAYVQHDLISSVFADDGPGFKGSAGKDFWADKPRLNILLLGGDFAEDRTGVRTDSMIVASIDTHTGDTVLLALPRNLQKARMPEGPARDRFPDGFTGDGIEGNQLLNAVWQYGQQHKDVVPGSKTPGADLLKATISETLGQKVDYYVLVNLFGFRDIVRAFGGVKIRITEPIPWGRENKLRIVRPDKVLQPGLQTLSGSEALWYVRSRSGSSDYSRMDRQRCMIGAIARQASPQVVFARFQQIASATKKVISTDLPAGLLPHLVTLAAKAKTSHIDSVTFSPPLITPADPDFRKIRKTAAQAIALSEKGEQPGQTAGATPTGTPSAGASSKTTRTGSKSSAGKKGPGSGKATDDESTAPRKKPAAVSVEQACQYT